MEYTEVMLDCLKKLSEWRLEELKEQIEKEFAGSEVFEYLNKLIYRAKDGT